MDVAHDIVTEFPLLLGGVLEVNVIKVVAHLLELLVADFDAEFLFGGRESGPKLAPRGELHGGRPNKGHLLGGVPGIFGRANDKKLI